MRRSIATLFFMRISIFFVLFFSLTALNCEAKSSFNEKLLGKWQGIAPTKKLCTGGRDNIHLEIVRPAPKPGMNYTVKLVADWGCFSKIEIPGFIFGDEFWAAADDRMNFVKLKLAKNNSLSGEFRFDLNGQSLEMDFSGLRPAP